MLSSSVYLFLYRTRPVFCCPFARFYLQTTSFEGGAQPTVLADRCAKINKKNRHFKASIFAFSPPEKSGRKVLMCNVLDMLKFFHFFVCLA